MSGTNCALMLCCAVFRRNRLAAQPTTAIAPLRPADNKMPAGVG